MLFLNFLSKKIRFLIFGTIILGLLTSCGIYQPSDARVVSPNSKERVKKNLEEGKGISFGKMMGDKGGTTYQFASSNAMWRATLEILDFLPLANVDYSGGIITTDWYNEGTSLDESIKITVRFLTNEVRSDGLKIIVHKKRCSLEQSCKITKITSTLEQELQVAILKKAIIFEKEYKKNSKKYKRGDVK
tara:strand:- start:1790 stop:2356 length:567 start_codon:yes stop_codon:yes gene_type:complete